MTQLDTQQWFERLWTDREERLYRSFFGTPLDRIHPLLESSFSALGKSDPDPRFLTHTVLEYPPTEARPHWLYVTSGMSNPWGESPATADPENLSGLGFEFILCSPEQSRWPIQLLHWLMAVQLLVASGELQGHLLERADRIPLGGPLWKRDGLLTHLLVTHPTPTPADHEPPLAPDQFQLASGKVDFMLLLGITQREADFATTQGHEPLITLLRHHHLFPLTDPARLSAI
jgi:Suppressor of fused protein (SUFU)